MWTDLTFYMMVIAQGLLLVGGGHMLVAQLRSTKIQVRLLKTQAELEQARAGLMVRGYGVAVGPSGVQSTSDWREMPPEAQQQLRHAMLRVLAEMDAAETVVRH